MRACKLDADGNLLWLDEYTSVKSDDLERLLLLYGDAASKQELERNADLLARLSRRVLSWGRTDP